MKILYAIQGTGNGHISRAREIIPLLQKYGELDIYWLQAQRNMAMEKMLECDEAAQILVLAKIVGLEAMAESCRRAVNDGNADDTGWADQNG